MELTNMKGLIVVISSFFLFYIDIWGKRLIFRYDRKIPDYFSVAGAP